MDAMVEYSVDDDDLVAFQEHHFRTSPAMRKTQTRNRYGVAVLYFLAGAVLLVVGATAAALLVALVAALWTALYPSYSRRVVRKRAVAISREGDNSNLYGPHQLSLEVGELVVSSPSGTTRIKAASIPRIDSTEAYLFIYLSGASALLIPRVKVRTGDLALFERELRAAAHGAA